MNGPVDPRFLQQVPNLANMQEPVEQGPSMAEQRRVLAVNVAMNVASAGCMTDGGEGVTGELFVSFCKAVERYVNG